MASITTTIWTYKSEVMKWKLLLEGIIMLIEFKVIVQEKFYHTANRIKKNVLKGKFI